MLEAPAYLGCLAEKEGPDFKRRREFMLPFRAGVAVSSA